MARKAIFIGATGQNVGKTTICLGLISLLKKTFPKVGFIKPVGQEHVEVENCILVDKDVLLFKEHFKLPSSYGEMSPVIIPKGFTRKYLDGKVDSVELEKKILTSFEKISSENDFTIVEGTGHIGVGSIINLNNAKVASLLGLDLVLIAKGGLGSAYDELALNKSLCDALGLKIRGVILNKVTSAKKEMVLNYMTKALKKWEIPILGCLPYNHFLNTPTLEDFEILFKTPLLSGQEFHYLHFNSIRLVATSLETFKEFILPNEMIITPATREDIIDHIIEIHDQKSPKHALILTGHLKPTENLIAKLKKSGIPSLYAARSSYTALQMITSYTAKISRDDTSKVHEAIRLVEENINLSGIMS